MRLFDVQPQPVVLLRAVREDDRLQHRAVRGRPQQHAIQQTDIPQCQVGGRHSQLSGGKQPARPFFRRTARGSQALPGIADRIRGGQRVRVIFGDMLHLQRREDLLPQQAHQRLPRHLLDDGASHHIPGVGILPLAPRREVQWPPGPLAQDGRHGRGPQHRRRHKILGPIVADAGGVIEKLPDRDLGGFAEVRKPLPNRILQRHFSLLDEEQHGRRGELLRDRSDRVPGSGGGGQRWTELRPAIRLRVSHHTILYHRDGG